MTAEEFKHWLEGFVRAVDGAPTLEQWKTVCETLRGVRSTEPFVPVIPVDPVDPVIPVDPFGPLRRSPSIPYWGRVWVTSNTSGVA